MTKEALKLAIEFAEYCLEELDLSHMASNQAKRLVQKSKEALAQTEQEPVAIVDSTISGHIDWLCTFFPKQGTKLYTTPPQRKLLTDEEIGAILEGVNAYGTRLYTFARAIEAELKEKNDC